MTPTVTVRAADLASLTSPLLALALPADPQLAPEIDSLSGGVGRVIARTLERRDFRGARDETLHLSGAEGGAERILLVGMGKVTDRASAIRRAAAIAARRAVSLGTGHLDFFAAGLAEEEAEAAA